MRDLTLLWAKDHLNTYTHMSAHTRRSTRMYTYLCTHMNAKHKYSMGQLVLHDFDYL